MKTELTQEQREAADVMFRELVGFTVAEARQILKTLNSELDMRAVVEEADDDG